MSSDKEDKGDKSEKNDKASVILRFIAYILDYLLVLFVATLVSMPFLDSKKTTDISDDMFNLIQKYNAKEINEEEYLIDLENIQYKLARTTEIYSIFLILVSVLYYVVLPLYYNGRTLGKKLMKLKSLL